MRIHLFFRVRPELWPVSKFRKLEEERRASKMPAGRREQRCIVRRFVGTGTRAEAYEAESQGRGAGLRVLRVLERCTKGHISTVGPTEAGKYSPA